MDTETCPSCGADAHATVETREDRRAAADERARKKRPPLIVTLLGVIYVLLAVEFVFLSGLLHVGQVEVDPLLDFMAGAIMLAPAFLFFIIGIGFFLRARWAHSGALLLGLLALVLLVVVGITAGLKDKSGHIDPAVIIGGILTLLAWAVHLEVLTSERVTGWFKN